MPLEPSPSGFSVRVPSAFSRTSASEIPSPLTWNAPIHSVAAVRFGNAQGILVETLTTPDSDSPSTTVSRRDIERARTIAKVMDRGYVDPILGFVVPGFGDILSAVFGLYVVAIAVRAKVPAVSISRMIINLGVDATVGAIPLLGDLFDIAFKSHSRNLAILEARNEAKAATASDWLYVFGAVFALVATIAIPIYVAFRLAQWLL